VPATVRDKHGQLISTLAKDDFVLEEDGRPQQVHISRTILIFRSRLACCGYT